MRRGAILAPLLLLVVPLVSGGCRDWASLSRDGASGDRTAPSPDTRPRSDGLAHDVRVERDAPRDRGRDRAVDQAPDPCRASPKIGARCADGSIHAGLSPDGNQPMFVTPCDAGMSWNGLDCTGVRAEMKWSYGATIATGITSKVTGRSNTASLVLLNGNADGPYEAAAYCDALPDFGHADWYLPAVNELSAIASHRKAIGWFSDVNNYVDYASSTEATFDEAASYYFASPFQHNYPKTKDFYVRCARR